MKTTHCSACLALAAVTALMIASTPPAPAWATQAGTVAPSLETAFIDALRSCDVSERRALDAISSFGDNEKVNDPSAISMAIGHLTDSSVCLDDLLSMILSTLRSSFDPKTLNAFKDLQKNLKAAFKSDGKASKKLLRQSKAKAIRKEIQKALDAKQAAKSNLQGTKAKRKDGPTNIPPSRFGIPGGPFYQNVYNANATAKYASNPVKNAGWQAFGDNGKVKRKRVKMEDGTKVNIWEFRAKKRDNFMTAGFHSNRSFGPPTFFAGTLGTYVMKEKKINDLGQASICYEAVRHNQSLAFQFYSVCVRPTAGGASIERYNENVSLGSMVFSGARQLDVMTEFNSTHFITWAGPRGESLMQIGVVQASWPLPWLHLTSDLQAFGFFGKAKLGLEGLAVFNEAR